MSIHTRHSIIDGPPQSEQDRLEFMLREIPEPYVIAFIELLEWRFLTWHSQTAPTNELLQRMDGSKEELKDLLDFIKAARTNEAERPVDPYTEDDGV